MLIIELLILGDLEYNPQLDHMIIFTHRILQDVINEDNYKSIKVIMNHSIHYVHNSRRGIS